MLRHALQILWKAAEGHRKNGSNGPCHHHAHKNFGAEQVVSLAAQPLEQQANGDLGGAVAS
jgi:hypothetical protein